MGSEATGSEATGSIICAIGNADGSIGTGGRGAGSGKAASETVASGTTAPASTGNISGSGEINGSSGERSGAPGSADVLAAGGSAPCRLKPH